MSSEAMGTAACELNIDALCPENNHGMAAQLITWVVSDNIELYLR